MVERAAAPPANIISKIGSTSAAVGAQAATLGNLVDESTPGFAGNVTKQAGAGTGVVGSVLEGLDGLYDRRA